MTSDPYESLVSASKSLVNVEILNGDDLPIGSAARAYLLANQPALEQARRALARKCSVNLRFDETFFEEHIQHLSSARNLTRSFELEIDVAVEAGQFAQAARSSIDLLDVANAIRRGGLMTSLLYGLCIAGIGVDRLRRSRSVFDADTCRHVISALTRIEREQEPFEEVARRDFQWESSVKDADADEGRESAAEPSAELDDDSREIVEVLHSFMQLPGAARQGIHRQNDQRLTALLRMLTVDLMLRAWHHEHRTYPRTLEDLSLGSEFARPVDPWSLQPFQYRTMPDGFQLYSPGPLQRDHGGILGPWPQVAVGAADLGLDSLDLCGSLPTGETFGSVLKGWIARMWARAASGRFLPASRNQGPFHCPPSGGAGQKNA